MLGKSDIDNMLPGVNLGVSRWNLANSPSQPPCTRRSSGDARISVDTISAIVSEYNRMIADLSRLTTELPNRLHVSRSRKRKPSTPRIHSPADTVTARNGLGCMSPNGFGGMSPIEKEKLQEHTKISASNGTSFDKGIIHHEVATCEDVQSKKIEIAEKLDLFGESKLASNNADRQAQINEVIGMTRTNSTTDVERDAWWCIFGSKRFRKQVSTADAQEKDIQDRLFAGASSAIESTAFDLMVGLLILANCIVIMTQLEYRGYVSEVKLGMIADDPDSWVNADDCFKVLEHLFNAAFLSEVVLRLAVFRLKICRDKSAVFDILIVLASSIQLYILDPIFGGSNLSNLSFLRVVRFVRFMRVLRVVRVLKMFSALRNLVRTIMSCCGALVTSMVLLLVMMVMGGLLLCELLLDFVQDDTQILTTRKWVHKYYGTSFRAIYTLFEVTLSGCWPNYFRPLIHDVSGWYVVFVLVYIAFVVFAVIRIITALFLKDTLQIANNDADMMVQEKLKSKEAYIKKLKNLFDAIDVSGDGKLSEDEFDFLMKSQKITSWLTCLELEVHDAKALFHILEDGTGEVTFDDFLKGLMRLKGQARTMDVVTIMQKVEKTQIMVKSIEEKINKLAGA